MNLESINKKTGKTLYEAINGLYVNLCKKTETEYDPPDSLTPFEVLNRIESAVAQILNSDKEYEQMIQNLEADVRDHIRIEQQLKLHIESTQYKIEEDQHKTEGNEHVCHLLSLSYQIIIGDEANARNS